MIILWWLFCDDDDDDGDLFYFRPDLEQLYDEYSALSTEELPNHDVPMMFISFPSAKDPSWHETNPGNHWGGTDIILFQKS